MAEFLVERASKDYEPINFDFLNEDLMVVSHVEEESSKKPDWKLYFDRAFNAFGHGVSAILITPEGEYYPSQLDWTSITPITWQNMKFAP